MPAFRLKENHPTAKKLEQVFKLMNELGLSIHVGPWNQTTVTDGNSSFRLMDIEGSQYSMDTFPVEMEYKLVYEK